LSVPPAPSAAAWKAATVALSGEGQVQRCGRLALPDEEVDPARRSPADAAPKLNLVDSERRERLTVEAPARLQVTNRNGEMIDQDLGF
jgi:hypothetical protein